MGFSLNLLIAHSEQHTVEKSNKRFMIEKNQPPAPFKAITLWNIEEIIAVGDITRIQKLTEPRFKHLRYSARRRAGICVTNEILVKLWDKTRKPKKSDFAPPFGIKNGRKESDLASSCEWKLDLRYEKISSGAECVLPMSGTFASQQIPAQEHMEEHNALLASPSLLKWVKKKYGIIMQRPFMWEKSSTVAQWLREMEEKKTDSWKELARDAGSLPYPRAWGAYLEQYGKLDTRVLFLFESVGISSLL